MTSPQRILRLVLDTSDYAAEAPIEEYVGVEAAGRVPVLGADGRIHPSLVRSREHIHEQLVAADSWVIAHNLGKRANVVIVDEGGETVFTDVRYDSPDQLTLLFGAPFAGTAYCS